MGSSASLLSATQGSRLLLIWTFASSRLELIALKGFFSVLYLHFDALFIAFLMILARQVSDPVAAEFSLNTQMFLLSKKELWLSNGSMGFGEGTDAAFSEGTTLLPSSGVK